MKFGVHMFLYNVNRFILPALANCGPHVDRIYVIYSEQPWSRYNAQARGLYRNRTSPDILDQSPYRDKITLLRGEWESEDDARNAALSRARSDGMDYLVVQDADEYYFHADYRKNLEFLAAHPEVSYFRAQWYLFWKSTDYIIQGWHGKVISNCENFAVNCRTPVTFSRYRLVAAPVEAALTVPGVGYHLSSVYSDEEMLEKLSTWGHAQQVGNRQRWFEQKWQYWTESTRFLSVIPPRATSWKAIRFDAPLPEVLRDFPNPDVVFRRKTTAQAILWRLGEGFDLLALGWWILRGMLSRAWRGCRPVISKLLSR